MAASRLASISASRSASHSARHSFLSRSRLARLAASRVLRLSAAKRWGGAVPQQEHEQRVVVDAAGAHELAVGVDRHLDAVESAVHGDVLEPLDAERKGGLPGFAEALALGVAAQEVGTFGGHVHRMGRVADRAGVGQRLDEAVLAFRRPAVVARALAGDGGELVQALQGALPVGLAGCLDHGRLRWKRGREACHGRGAVGKLPLGKRRSGRAVRRASRERRKTAPELSPDLRTAVMNRF